MNTQGAKPLLRYACFQQCETERERERGERERGRERERERERGIFWTTLKPVSRYFICFSSKLNRVSVYVSPVSKHAQG